LVSAWPLAAGAGSVEWQVIARSEATRQSSILIGTTMSCFVYIMTNANNTVLYAGVTNNLLRRMHEHKTGEGSGFTKRYQITKLVFCERFDLPEDAIAAEKRIKAGSRAKKVALIEGQNPSWRDLAEDL
jgi:putative endonuclease